MKFDNNVQIIRQNKVKISNGEKEKEIKQDDLLIVDMLEAGITEDDLLISKISEAYNECDISARLRLTLFIEEYGDFIAPGDRDRVFG